MRRSQQCDGWGRTLQFIKSKDYFTVWQPCNETNTYERAVIIVEFFFCCCICQQPSCNVQKSLGVKWRLVMMMMMATLRTLVGQSKMLQRSRAMLLEMEPGQSYPSAFYYTAATMLDLNRHCALHRVPVRCHPPHSSQLYDSTNSLCFAIFSRRHCKELKI